MDLVHLSHHGHELPKPYVVLLGRRRVEKPLVVDAVELRKPGRVTIHDAETIRVLVFANGMKHVDGQAYLQQALVPHAEDVFEELAIVVVEQEARERARKVSREDAVDEGLFRGETGEQ